ncbi:MAG: SCO family protein [bacterium]|nr:SCO family protein [bacterium]
MNRLGTYARLVYWLFAVLVVSGRAHAAPRLPDMGSAMPLALRDAVTGAPLLDEVRDKTVLLSFIATTCREACPITEGTFSAVADVLRSERLLGSKVVLVLVTLDPVTDTPVRLRATARELGAPTRQLVFATGSEKAVRRILAAYEIAVHFKAGTRRDPDHDVVTLLIDPHLRVRYEFSPSYPPRAVANVTASLARSEH